MIEEIVGEKDYVKIAGGLREVRKLYYDVLSNDYHQILEKIKEERDKFLSNIERDSKAYNEAQKRYSDRHFEITSQLAEINKKRG